MKNISTQCKCLFFTLLLGSLVSSAQNNSFRVQKIIELGGEGGWDYPTIDPATHRLYIARSNRVMVVDAVSGKILAEVPGTEGVHGIAIVPDAGRGFASDGRSDTVTVFDLKSLSPVSSIPVGGIPDAIIFDPSSRRVLTFNARTHDATVIDPDALKVTGTVPLGGKPEFAVPDGNGGMYVNIEDRKEVAHFDILKSVLLHKWPIAGCEDPTGLSFDRPHARLFIGCSNEKLAVMDSQSGRVTASLPIGAGVDGTAFDPGLQVVFASTGSGILSIIHEDSPDKFSKIDDLATAPGARTMTLDPATHTVYLVTGKPLKDQSSGQFRLLVVSR